MMVRARRRRWRNQADERAHRRGGVRGFFCFGVLHRMLYPAKAKAAASLEAGNKKARIAWQAERAGSESIH